MHFALKPVAKGQQSPDIINPKEDVNAKLRNIIDLSKKRLAMRALRGDKQKNKWECDKCLKIASS